jgi:hypothetical protein
MAIIGLGKIDKSLIPIIVGCVFCFVNRIINQYDGSLLLENKIIPNIFIAFSDLLTLIPYLILKKRSKQIKDSDIQITKTYHLEYIYTNSDLENTQGKGRFILLSGVILFVEAIMFASTFKIKSNSWYLYILITSAFYYIIFKIKLFKHHYLSIIIIILSGIIIDLVLGNLQNDFLNHFFLLLISILRIILLSFYYVIVKYTIEKKFVSVYEIIFFIGIINFVMFIIFAIFDYFFFDIDDYEKYFTNFNGIELLVALGVMITQLGMDICITITDKNESPCHIFIIFVFGQLAYYFFNLNEYLVIVIICLILMLFFTLVFNEIIEINLWGLSLNTKRNIINRAQSDGDETFIVKSETFEENNEKDDNAENLIELKNNEVYDKND